MKKLLSALVVTAVLGLSGHTFPIHAAMAVDDPADPRFGMIKQENLAPFYHGVASGDPMPDLAIIRNYLRRPASVFPECDIDEDGMITLRDARKLARRCDCPCCRCQ